MAYKLAVHGLSAYVRTCFGLAWGLREYLSICRGVAGVTTWSVGKHKCRGWKANC